METEISTERTTPLLDAPQIVAEVRKLSIEEIEKQYAQPLEEEKQGEPEVIQKEEEYPAKKEEVKPPEEKPEEKKVEEPQKQETITKEEYHALLKRVEEQESRIAAKERFAQRQATELGLLRKQTPEEERRAIQEANERYEQIYLEQGRYAADEYMNNFRQARQNHLEAIRAAEEHQAFTERISRNKENIHAYVTDFDARVNDLVTLMEEDKADAEQVRIFRENPYVADPVLLYNMTKRAELKAELTTLRSQLAEKDARIAELEQKPTKLIERIATATKSMDGKSSGTKTPEVKINFTGMNPRRMSLADLERAEKELTQNTV